MNLDPRTVVILTVLSTLLMGIGLLVVARGYLAEMRGISRWAAGTLLQSTAWILLALFGVIPDTFSEFGGVLIMLAMALYFHALTEFLEKPSPVLWVYAVVGINFIAIYYFLLFVPDVAARIVVASATAAVLMFASARILLFGSSDRRPLSHSMTGMLFLGCSLVLVARAIYYLVWNTAPDQSALEQNIMQDIAFLTFFMAAVLSPFTFLLMCNDRYNAKALLYTQELDTKNLELEAASQAKGLFLATMSHELRTPLNGIIGFLKHLGKTRLDDQQKDYFHSIDLSARLLLSVINDVLDFSKIEAGKLSIESIAIELREFCDEVILLFAVSAEDKGLELVCVIDKRLPNSLMGDPVRLTQVLANLLSNAIKFTAKGKVLLEVRLVGETDSNVSLEIRVTDSGIGISQEALSRLFQPFTQADASTTRKHGGTGLGLVIAKKIVEMMGGSIVIESKVGQGTCFTVHLDMLKQHPGNQQEKISNVSPIEKTSVSVVLTPLKGKRVLIVDDNSINRKLAQLLVTELGGEFDFAEDGVQAVDAFTRKEFDLILMDVNMPVMDGLEACARIRALEESSSRQTLIIALTANAMPGDKERFINCGMDDYLSKPIDEKALFKVLHRFFPQRLAQVPLIKIESAKLIESSKDATENTTPALDPAIGIKLCFGDADTWQMALGMMLDELQDYSDKIKLASNDMTQLRLVSHKLVGSTCYCGTPALLQAVKQVEIHCTLADFHLIESLLLDLQKKIDRLLALDAGGKLRGSEVVVY